MRRMNTWKITGLAMLAAGSIAGQSASADPQPITLSVSYADLDLTSSEDLERLRARIKRASRDICGVESLFELGSVSAFQEAKACYRSVVVPAMEQATAIASSRLASASRAAAASDGD